MSSFEKFKEVFEETFNGSIYLFLNKDEWKYEDIEYCPFSYKEVENLDNPSYDSYGNEDTDLKRVFYIQEYDIHVMFTGNRSSYQGEEWYDYKEVKETTKTVSIWM